MTDEDEPLRRFRAEIPAPEETAWTKVRAALAREIAAEDARGRGGARSVRRRSPRLLAVALAGLALTGAVAYGATSLIGVGAPAPNPPMPLEPSNIKVLGLRVADPAGGPPWGLRLALSQPRARFGPRAGVAIQIGRIRDGQMGFIGRDGVFGDDQLFHVAGPNSALITPADYSISGTPQKPDLQGVYHFALTLPGVTSAYEGCSNVKVPYTRPRVPKRAIETERRTLRQQLAIVRAGGPAAQLAASRYGGSLGQLRLALEQDLRALVAEPSLQPKLVFEAKVRGLRHQIANLRRGQAAARRAAGPFGGSVRELRLTLEQALREVQQRARGYTLQRTFNTCPSADLRTIIFGFAGLASTSVTISGWGFHETEQLHSDDDGFYLFVLASHWNYGSKFTDVVTCAGGGTVRGVAAPGTPDAPYCRGR